MGRGRKRERKKGGKLEREGGLGGRGEGREGKRKEGGTV